MEGETILGLLFLIMIGVFASWFIFIQPIVGVWQSEQYGKAELVRATYSKQVAVQEAQAKDDSATLLAEAEVKRAQGVAQANQIIGDSLKGNEDYLRYLYINGLTENATNKEIIYIPTEAGIPILEAGKR